MLNEFEIRPYLEEAQERVTEQFKNKDVFERYLRLVLEKKMEVQEVVRDLMQNRSIDTAVGKQLDIIGEIVGQPRILVPQDVIDAFGFEQDETALGFSTVSNPEVGGVLRSLIGEIRTPIEDTVYRLFIKAKIIKNTTASTPDEFIRQMEFLFSNTEVFIEEGIAEVTVYFDRELSDLERYMLDYTSYSSTHPIKLVPRTLGVNFNYGYLPSGGYFGFQEDPDAKPFYSTSPECTGTLYLDGSQELDGKTFLDGGESCFMPDGGFFAELL